jgi:hypothetical protein
MGVHGTLCAHIRGTCLQIRVSGFMDSNCLDEEYNYYSFEGCATLTVPPAVWKQKLKPNKGTLKLSFTATLEDCATVSPGGIPNPLQGTKVQVNLDLVCKPTKSTSKCIQTFDGTHECPASS